MAKEHDRVDGNAGVGGTLGSGGGGSNDATSGGGAGAGIPDAETAMRLGDTVTRGDVKQDKAKLFPEAAGQEEGDRPPGHAIPPPKGG